VLDPTLYISIATSLGMIMTPLNITYKNTRHYSFITSFCLFLLFAPIQPIPIQSLFNFPNSSFSHVTHTLLSLSLSFSHPNRSTHSVTRTILADSLTVSVLSFRCSIKLKGAQTRVYAAILRQKTQRFSCAAILITPFDC